MTFITPRQILNEISSRDAYVRFYQPKGIPESVYNRLMEGQPTMTPFHKKVLETIEMYVQIIEQCRDDSSREREMESTEAEMNAIAQYAADMWNNFDSEQKTMTVEDVESFDNSHILSFSDLHKMSDQLSKMKWRNQASAAKDGLIKFYENDKMYATCTLTYAANTKYYGDSPWCTASDMDGRYDGWGMFVRYAIENKCFLVQFVDKKNRENSLQVAIDIKGEIGEANDWEHKELDDYGVINWLKEHGVENYDDIFEGEYTTSKLYWETRNAYGEEEKVMSRYIKNRLAKIKRQNEVDFNDKGLIERVKEFVIKKKNGTINTNGEGYDEETGIYYGMEDDNSWLPNENHAAYVVTILPKKYNDTQFVSNQRELSEVINWVILFYDGAQNGFVNAIKCTVSPNISTNPRGGFFYLHINDSGSYVFYSMKDFAYLTTFSGRTYPFISWNGRYVISRERGNARVYDVAERKDIEGVKDAHSFHDDSDDMGRHVLKYLIDTKYDGGISSTQYELPDWFPEETTNSIRENFKRFINIL